MVRRDALDGHASGDTIHLFQGGAYSAGQLGTKGLSSAPWNTGDIGSPSVNLRLLSFACWRSATGQWLPQPRQPSSWDHCHGSPTGMRRWRTGENPTTGWGVARRIGYISDDGDRYHILTTNCRASRRMLLMSRMCPHEHNAHRGAPCPQSLTHI